MKSTSQQRPLGRDMKEKFTLRKGIPGVGWSLVDTIDNGLANHECENCGFPHVRYVHILRYKSSNRTIGVGCTCAQHLTGDFSTPQLREKTLRGLAGRRMRWPTLNWKRSRNGNLYLKKQGRLFVVKSINNKWVASYKCIDVEPEQWMSIRGWHNTPELAKLAAFDVVYIQQK